MANVKTITLGGTEQEVIISGQNCDIRNDGAEIVYASAKPNVTAGEDGVLAIPVGQAAKLLDTRGAVYLLGTGIVQLCGNDYGYLVFKSAPAGGGSGGTQDDVARNMASANAASISALRGDVEDIQTVAENISNPNLVGNPWFGKGVINQRGKTEYSGAGFSIDRWNITTNTRLVVNENSITVSASGGEGWFGQGFEDSGYYTGKTFTASLYLADGTVVVGSGTCPERTGALQRFLNVALPNDIGYLRMYRTKESDGDKGLSCDIMLTDGNSAEFKGIKVEFGAVATPFVIPNPTTELAKCQRYYIGPALDGFGVSMTSNVYYVTFPLPVTMRVNPSLENATFTVRDKLTNQVVTDLDDATPYVADVNIIRANSITVGFRKTAHGITDIKYTAQLFGGLSADL